MDQSTRLSAAHPCTCLCTVRSATSSALSSCPILANEPTSRSTCSHEQSHTPPSQTSAAPCSDGSPSSCSGWVRSTAVGLCASCGLVVNDPTQLLDLIRLPDLWRDEVVVEGRSEGHGRQRRGRARRLPRCHVNNNASGRQGEWDCCLEDKWTERTAHKLVCETYVPRGIMVVAVLSSPPHWSMGVM